MKKISMITLCTLVCLIGFTALPAAADSTHNPPPVSGKVVHGYRLLAIPMTAAELTLTIYRGDYIKFEIDPSMAGAVLSIPQLDIQAQLTADIERAPYFKMKQTGAFQFSLGSVSGTIAVVDFRQARYTELNSRQAADLMGSADPLILDVRTPHEFKKGHLKGALLIPVQELHSRIKELSPYQNGDILIYCATGNRSTVASKMLLDGGFKQIYNLRYGIYQWGRDSFPVVR